MAATGFRLPAYTPPDFASEPLASAPPARTGAAPADGVAPEGFHATSNHPEYVHLGEGAWTLAAESRMDCCIVVRDGELEVVEARRLTAGDAVVLGRTEDGEDGVFVHTGGFDSAAGGAAGAGGPAGPADKFSFRTRGTRETPFSRSYDELYNLMRHEREHGCIAWVLGPAVAFDKDSRVAMQELIGAGYCHAMLAGNALATHDLEASVHGTGLGQDIYTQVNRPLGHYNHLDVLNAARRAGSVDAFLRERSVTDGIIHACRENGVPTVLAGSIRDDGPLPGVLADVYAAQDAMRAHARKATTCLALATQLHSIAFGNMLPGYQVTGAGGGGGGGGGGPADVRPVYFYIVDMSEFSADKLANRGSMQATAILTNVQDFVINLWRNLGA